MWIFEKMSKGLKLMAHIDETLDSILFVLKEIKMLSVEMQALVDQAAETNGVEASAVVVIQGYLAQITDLLGQINLSTEDRAKATEVTASMKEATDALANSIAVTQPPDAARAARVAAKK